MQMLETDGVAGLGVEAGWRPIAFGALAGPFADSFADPFADPFAGPFAESGAMVLGSFAAIAAPGLCVTCRWASGDGVVFECELRSRVTQNEGCAAWEREPGAD
ncbi:MAG: hypothetical protein JWR80_6477 [Bradyrhizobium sp.]|nr:hypothetical protein [Bradyrhizobium sp.]